MKKLFEIPDTEGRYAITKSGDVYSYPKGPDGRHRKGLYLTPSINDTGYVVVNLSIGGKSKPYLLHRLVAITFIENPENKPEVNHKDGNKSNYALNNLEWCTRKENVNHAIDVLHVKRRAVPRIKSKIMVDSSGNSEFHPKGFSIQNVIKIFDKYYKNKATLREIGDEFNRSHETIRQLLLDNKYKRVYNCIVR